MKRRADSTMGTASGQTSNTSGQPSTMNEQTKGQKSNTSRKASTEIGERSTTSR